MPLPAVPESFSAKPVRRAPSPNDKKPDLTGEQYWAPSSKQPSNWYPYPVQYSRSSDGHDAKYSFISSEYCTIATDILLDEDRTAMVYEDYLSEAHRVQTIRDQTKSDAIESMFKEASHAVKTSREDIDALLNDSQSDPDDIVVSIADWFHARGQHGGGCIPHHLNKDGDVAKELNIILHKVEDMELKLRDSTAEDRILSTTKDAYYAFESFLYSFYSSDPRCRRTKIKQSTNSRARGELYTNLLNPTFSALRRQDSSDRWQEFYAVIYWTWVRSNSNLNRNSKSCSHGNI